MDSPEALVYIVDDDQELCTSLAWLLESVNIRSRIFNEVASFLATYEPGVPACLVLDVRMPKGRWLPAPGNAEPDFLADSHHFRFSAW